MILRSNKLQNETTLEEKDGKIHLTRYTNIEPLLQSNFESRKDPNNGWAKDRSYRKIASVPMDVWLTWTKQHPELLLGDKELRDKVLKKLMYEEENRPFWSVAKGI